MGLFAIGILGEIPWRAIIFCSVDVEGIEALDIDISTDIVRMIDYGAAAAHFNKSGLAGFGIFRKLLHLPGCGRFVGTK